MARSRSKRRPQTKLAKRARSTGKPTTPARKQAATAPRRRDGSRPSTPAMSPPPPEALAAPVKMAPPASGPPSGPAVSVVAPAASVVAETELLQLAREVSGLHAAGVSLADVLAHLASAWADGPLPLARSEAFAARRRDKSAALALAWAREQVRVALEEALERERESGRIASDAPLGTMSWVLVAASEALGWEPPGDVDERIAALLAFSGARPPGSR